MDDPRLTLRGDDGGNGKSRTGRNYVANDLLTTTSDRKLPKFGVEAVWKAVRWTALATAFVLSTYFGVVTKLKGNDERLDSMREEIVALKQSAKSKESADGDMSAIRAELQAIGQRLDSIDRRLDSMETRRR